MQQNRQEHHVSCLYSVQRPLDFQMIIFHVTSECTNSRHSTHRLAVDMKFPIHIHIHRAYPQIFSWISTTCNCKPVYGLHVKLPLRFHKAQQGVGRHIKTTMAQAFLSEIVIKMHKSKQLQQIIIKNVQLVSSL